MKSWGTIKATNAKACALYYEIVNVGKTIESSKKRITWRLKIEEGNEFEISLTHSLASGKKVLRVDGIVKYSSKGLSLGDWDYVFNLLHGHVVHIIIKPSVDLNDMYDLIVDGMSFRRLPERFEDIQPSNIPHGGRRSVPDGIPPRERPPTRNSSGGERDPSSHNGSYGPWECPQCTLVNEKPLAPVCEACGNPKPSYISAESRERARRTLDSHPIPDHSPRAETYSSHDNVNPSNGADFMTNESPHSDIFNPFGDDRQPSSPFSTSANDPFAPGPTSSGISVASNGFEGPYSHQNSAEDITSMLGDLDFSTAPIQPFPIDKPGCPQELFNTSPLPESPTETRMPSDDLWDSNMVSLDLNHLDKPKSTSVRSMQTLEQARKMQGTSEKPVVIPSPVPSHPVPISGPYGGVSGVGFGVYGTAPAQNGYAMPSVFQGYQHQYLSGGGAPASPSPFANTNPAQHNQIHGRVGGDPFATLS